ncbi:MAG: Omp28 family outer membrane lipoprotein [Prevotella sp.]|nr:Omp28 family outer membrane lipoprotein [Prevotella sp.]MBQ9645849.1 Omp28 family outer membrane lipoprotein [Prevotella sp.]
MKTKDIHRLFFGLLAGCGVAAALASCSNIAEDERMLVVSTNVVVDSIPEDPVEADSLWDAPITPVEHRVLIEDHTGQKCPNCPDGARLIRQLQRQYGQRIVPVAIHSQMQGIMEPEGLGTELGNTYYNYWKMEFKPAGLVNRLDGGDGKVLDKTIWIMAAEYALAMEPPLDVRVKAQLQDGDPTKADVDVKVICTAEGQSVSGKLQVWITEDGIIAEQDDMGTKVTDYEHNHVLRATVNGTWGEDVSVSGLADTREFHYTATLNPAWKTENLSIVAFVYNNDEVVQVVSRALKVE